MGRRPHTPRSLRECHTPHVLGRMATDQIVPTVYFRQFISNSLFPTVYDVFHTAGFELSIAIAMHPGIAVV